MNLISKLAGNGPYSRSSVKRKLRPVIALHGITVNEKALEIPGPGMDYKAELPDRGVIPFEEIDYINSSCFFKISILLRNGYLYTLSKTDNIKTCVRVFEGTEGLTMKEKRLALTVDSVSSNIDRGLDAVLDKMSKN